jgi:hypothetical protein
MLQDRGGKRRLKKINNRQKIHFFVEPICVLLLPWQITIIADGIENFIVDVTTTMTTTRKMIRKGTIQQQLLFPPTRSHDVGMIALDLEVRLR